MPYARILRGELLIARGHEYVLAARVGGLSRLRIVVRHLLPNTITQSVVYAMSDIVFMMLAIVTLSYLGLGLPPPTPGLGGLIAEGQNLVTVRPELVTIPGPRHRGRRHRGVAGRRRPGRQAGPAVSLLEVRDLCVDVPTADGPGRAVDGVSFDVEQASSMGLVGESGSGKSLTLRAVLGLMPRGATLSGGSIRLNGRELVDLPPRQRREVCGTQIAYIPQEPLTALNPVMRIGDQIAEGPRTRQGVSKSAARTLVRDLLRDVGIGDPDRRADAYPHQLSGGMRQRVAIAMALSCAPDLILADEPTTALDVTVQDQVLSLLHDLQQRRGASLVFVTHDLAVVARTCEQLTVMYGGQARRERPHGAAARLPVPPVHRGPAAGPARRRGLRRGSRPSRASRPAPATGWPAAGSPRAASGPRSGARRRRRPSCATVSGTSAACARSSPRRPRDQLDPPAHPGRAGLRGRTCRCCASSTRRCASRSAAAGCCGASAARSSRWPASASSCAAARSLGWSASPAAARRRWGAASSGSSRSSAARSSWPARRSGARAAPSSAGGCRWSSRTRTARLNPRRTIRSVIVELLQAHADSLPTQLSGTGRGAARWEPRCRELMDMVGLPVSALDRYPEQFSGGQRQRVSIARALAVQPDVLVADEPVSALDVSVQATILNLLSDLRADLGLAVLFISHDIGVVRHICDRVAVMYLGRVVEEGPAGRLLAAPTHPYTAALIASVPTLPASPTRAAVLPGEPPSPIDPPPGCAFHPRCARRTDVCARRPAAARPRPVPPGSWRAATTRSPDAVTC